MPEASKKMFLNVILLGFAFMLIFTAFQTCSMIEQLVISNMVKEYPGYKADAYTSLAVIYAVFALANWLAPSIVSFIGQKYAMFIGGITYCLFIANFFFHYAWVLYLASVLIGFGASVIWTGQGSFLTDNSDSTTMSRNSGIFWALLQCSLLFGNIFVYFEFQGKEIIDESTRTTVFIVLLVVCVLGSLLLLVLRGGKKNTAASLDISESSGVSPSPMHALVRAFTLLRSKEMMFLSVTFFYTGLELSFFSGVYGTCIGFTKRLGDDSAKFAGIAGILIGAGEIIGGASFGLLGKKTNKYGRDPIILLGYIVHIISFFFIFINFPSDAPFHATTKTAYITSSIEIALVCAFGLGLGDACFNTQLYSILGTLYPDDSAPAFALFKFFQSVAAAVAFFYSTHLLLQYQLLILVIFGTLGAATFWIIEWNTYKYSSASANSERKE